MVIVEILGGLGNQLSAYACGYSIAKHLGQELVLDVSDYTYRGYFRPYCLDKLKIGSHRKLVYPPFSPNFMDEAGIPPELRNKGLRILKHEDYPTRKELLNAAEDAENIYLLGYGGLHYCTPEDQIEIKEQFQLKEPSSAVEQFTEKIRPEFSVAVHLRRTDFVALGCASSLAYYQAAITYLKIFHPDAHFYFFSDDIDYAKEQFGPCTNYHYVHLLGGMDSDLDEFFCISACNARILTRQSSFSAWATKLSQDERRLNLCQEYENPESLSPDQIYLNQTAIDTLSAHYQAEKSDPAESSLAVSVNDTVFQLVAGERNDEAVKAIDRACIDSYGLSEANTQELTVFRGIALAQKGEAGLPAALRTFYRQMQTEYENPAFHANYFRALYQSGYIAESAIHAALANRFGDQEDYQPYFAQMDPFGQKLYQLLQNSPVRHFIFIPVEGWSFYITYVKSLAALLARMGQKVSFFQMTNQVVKGNDDTSIAKAMLANVSAADSVYKYHIDMIPSCLRADGGQNRFLLYELVRQCAGRFDMPAVVVASHPNVFSDRKVAGVKYVTPDIFDPLNRERMILEGSGIRMEDYINHMASRSDVVFLSGPGLSSAKKKFGKKIRPAVPTWEGPSYQILESELDITPNYISSEQMIQNAAALLEI